MLKSSCAILFTKRIYYFWEVDGVFVNIQDIVFKKINTSLLHDEDILFVCESKLHQLLKY